MKKSVYAILRYLIMKAVSELFSNNKLCAKPQINVTL